jgi:DNA-binding NtrC family response regulator
MSIPKTASGSIELRDGMTGSEPVLLVLDDDESVRLSLGAFFEDRGWKILLCASGEEALAKIKSHTIAAAIVDIRMKGLTGDAFIRESLRLNASIAFIICTGSLDYQLPVDLRESFCVSPRVFNKPLMNMDEMESELNVILGRLQTF